MHLRYYFTRDIKFCEFDFWELVQSSVIRKDICCIMFLNQNSLKQILTTGNIDFEIYCFMYILILHWSNYTILCCMQKRMARGFNVADNVHSPIRKN